MGYARKICYVNIRVFTLSIWMNCKTGRQQIKILDVALQIFVEIEPISNSAIYTQARNFININENSIVMTTIS